MTKSSQNMTQKLQALANTVKDAEEKFVPETSEWMFTLVGRAAFDVSDAPRKAIHIPTSSSETIEIMDELTGKGLLPREIKAADLGCGLGSFVCSLSIYLENNNSMGFHVTGIDFSPSLLAEAKRIAGELSIKNVAFIKKDFMEMTEADFNAYNIIYMFKPFKEGFNPLMEDLLPKIKPGTLLITRMFREVEALKSGLFKFIYHPLQDKYGDDFAAHIKNPGI